MHLRYDAPPTCPDEGAFLDRMRARARRIRRADPSERARAITVSITGPEDDESFAGRVVVEGEGGAEPTRDVAGDTCEEVVDALALISALSIGRDVPPSEVMAPPPAPTTPPAEPSPPATVQRPTLLGERWHGGVGGGVALVSGVAPSTVPAGVAFVAAHGPARGLVASSFRLGFMRGSSGDVEIARPGIPAPSSAAFTWTVVAADACPLRLRHDTLSLEPCARIEVGMLQGAGGRIAPPREQTRWWIAAAAVARGQWAFAGPFFFELEAGLRAPLSRTQFFFQPDTTIFRAPAVTWSAGAGLGVRFP